MNYDETTEGRKAQARIRELEGQIDELKLLADLERATFKSALAIYNNNEQEQIDNVAILEETIDSLAYQLQEQCEISTMLLNDMNEAREWAIQFYNMWLLGREHLYATHVEADEWVQTATGLAFDLADERAKRIKDKQVLDNEVAQRVGLVVLNKDKEEQLERLEKAFNELQLEHENLGRSFGRLFQEHQALEGMISEEHNLGML